MKQGKQSINYGIYGIPESILLDENLIVIKKFIGPILKDDYEFIIKKNRKPMKKTIFIFFILLININFSSAKILVEDPNKIFKNLRCLICQGQSVADSNSDFAQTIKLVVKDKIAEGTSEEEIYEFLIEKYGEWIVYKPHLMEQIYCFGRCHI